jgi:hypothetical protein
MKFLKLFSFLLLCSPCCLIAAAPDSADAPVFGGLNIKFNAFGDIIYGKTFGKSANQAATNLYDKFNPGGYPTGMHNGFTMHGIDFLNTVTLKDHFKVQTEVNIEGSRGADGGAFEVEMERSFMEYKFTEAFGLQAGLMFTPIGYINRNLYSRAWMMNSIRFYQSVETDAGLIPNHFVGVTAFGNFNFADGTGLNYIVGYGNGRPRNPAKGTFNLEEKGYQTTALIELTPASVSEIRIGLSGFNNEVHINKVTGLGDIVNITDSGPTAMVINELGFNPYLLYKGKLAQILVEYQYVYNLVKKGDYPSKTGINSLSAELALNFYAKKNRIAPYIRYDYILMPKDEGPYYSLRSISETQMTKVYTPDFNAVMVGICYDVSSFYRFKLEYIHHFDGPYLQNGVFVQWAFGF